MKTHIDTLPGPEDIHRRVLPNGIVVLVRENFQARSVVITGALEAGAVYEPANAQGTASFVASALMRGTEHYDFASLHDVLESNGAKLSISGGTHTVGFSGKSLAEDLSLLVNLLAESLRRPIFPERQIERLRGEILNGMRSREQSTRYMASHAFRRLLYEEHHPYSRPSDGSADSVKLIQRQQLLEYWQKTFGPRDMVLIVVGAVHAEAVFDLIQQAFGDWQNSDQPPHYDLPNAVKPEVRQVEHVPMRDKSQTDLILGVLGPSRFDSDWEAATLANNILGVFGMYGRIGAEVREKRGMAYYSYSGLDGGLGPGPWKVLAGVNPANLAPAIEAIRGEIQRLTTELVSDDELADSKANFTGRLPLQLESNEGVAGSIMLMERYRLGLDYLRRYPDVISAISAEEILGVAQHYWGGVPDALATAGPPLSEDPQF